MEYVYERNHNLEKHHYFSEQVLGAILQVATPI